MSEKLTNAQFADLLRSIARVYDERPEIPQPYHMGSDGGTEFVFCNNKEQFAATIRAFGPGRKDQCDDCLLFYPDITRGIGLRIYGHKHNCCERVQIGQKVVPAHAEQVIPAAPERVEPVYEWHCAPFLEAAGVGRE